MLLTSFNMSESETESWTRDGTELEIEVENGRNNDCKSLGSLFTYKRNHGLEKFRNEIEKRSKTRRDAVMKAWQECEALEVSKVSKVSRVSEVSKVSKGGSVDVDNHGLGTEATRMYNLQSSADYTALESFYPGGNWYNLLLEGRLYRDQYKLTLANYGIMGMYWPPQTENDISRWNHYKERH
jgi:hypothetical protein